MEKREGILNFTPCLKLNETEQNHGGVAKLPSKEIIKLFSGLGILRNH